MKLKTSLLIISLGIGLSAFYAISKPEIAEEKNVLAIDDSFAEIKFHYVDEFTLEEKNKIEKWLMLTSEASQRVLGFYPFDLNFYLHRADGSSEPVPWANTQRSTDQGVNFHVDTSFPIEDFLKDWTAPHEISHLAIPFVGKSNSWFAEGFASYMQNEILLEMGECTQLDIDNKFKAKLDNARPYYQENEAYSKVAMDLRKRHKYPEMYWGGSVFFIQLDEILKKDKNISLCQLLAKYQDCCRLEDNNLSDLMESWNKITESKLASELMFKYTTVPAREIFPN